MSSKFYPNVILGSSGRSWSDELGFFQSCSLFSPKLPLCVSCGQEVQQHNTPFVQAIISVFFEQAFILTNLLF